MSEVQRYDWVEDEFTAGMELFPQGEYVRYEDHAAALADERAHRVDDWRELAEEHAAALAAKDAEIAELRKDVAEAEARSRIDEAQCDDMTDQAGAMASEIAAKDALLRKQVAEKDEAVELQVRLVRARDALLREMAGLLERAVPYVVNSPAAGFTTIRADINRALAKLREMGVGE